MTEESISPEAKQALKEVISDLVPTQPTIVMPAVTVVQAKDAWDAYQELKQAVMTKDDVQVIQGNNFLKKSYWRKIATFFNLSVDIVNEWREGDETKGENVTYHFVCKAVAPNGRYAIGAGSCDLLEKGRANTIHNARSTAETRAWNRAVSNLVGGGEVSAEEMILHEPAPRKRATAPAKPQQKWVESKDKVDQSVCKADHTSLKVFTVNKPGKNQGRKFKACQHCNFFTWEN